MVFLIAEIGVNWDGDFDLLKKMTNQAKKIGFDSIKLQSFDENIVKDHPEKNRLLKTSVSKENINTIDDISKESKIEWFCTPMYPEAVDLIETYVKKIKIREFDARQLLENNKNSLLEKILKTKKTIIASSQQSPKKCNFKNIEWLYCVPKYPCELSDLDFSEFQDFSGYSNHCPQIIAPIVSAALGAEFIEVHITENKNQKYVDNPVSFDFDECKDLVKKIRQIEKIKRIIKKNK